MKKKFSMFLVFAFIAITCFGFINVQEVKAATIGKQLLQPEAGWQRFDDSDSKIILSGNWYQNKATFTGNYNSIVSISEKDLTSKITFKFYGTKLRIIGLSYSDRSTDTKIIIDGNIIENYNEKYSSSLLYQVLHYEKDNLNREVHTVEISKQTADCRMSIDAIDIDSDGYLIDPSNVPATGISLNKTSLDMKIGQTDNLIATVLPEDATNKKILWTSSDESIATVDANGNVAAIKEGQATITAKIENTNLTATCEVNVNNPVEVNKNGAILSISLVNGATKEYNVSMQEVDKFISWFEERSNGNGLALYSFSKKISPYKSVREYIVHYKIASFEVREYEVTE